MTRSNLALANPAPVAFVSDPDAGLYFWSHSTADGSHVQYSNRPHPLLPHRCDVHDWYSAAPCQACEVGPYVRDEVACAEIRAQFAADAARLAAFDAGRRQLDLFQAWEVA